MSDLVGNPEDRFSRVAAHLFSCSPECFPFLTQGDSDNPKINAIYLMKGSIEGKNFKSCCQYFFLCIKR